MSQGLPFERNLTIKEPRKDNGSLAKWWKVPLGVEIPAERQQGIVDFLMAWIEKERTR